MSNWKTISSSIVHKNPYWAVAEDQVTRPDGSPGVYYVAKRPDFASVVAVNDKQEIYLIHQLRYPTQRAGWEIPQGLNDPGEDNMQTAQRELREETGLSAAQWHKLGSGLEAEKGFTDSFGHIFVATDLTQTGTNDQIEEGIDACRAFALAEVKDMIRRGDIIDDFTLASLYLAELHGHLR